MDVTTSATLESIVKISPVVASVLLWDPIRSLNANVVLTATTVRLPIAYVPVTVPSIVWNRTSSILLIPSTLVLGVLAGNLPSDSVRGEK